jgi:hypothetical protein
VSVVEDLSVSFQDYIQSPINQVNLGWTVTSLLFTLPVLIGILIILYSLIQFLYNENYINGSSPKKAQITAMWVGFGMIIFGFFGAVYNFSKIVKKINLNIKTYGVKSLFQIDNSLDVIEGSRRQIQSRENLQKILSKNTSNFEQSSAYAQSSEQIIAEKEAEAERRVAEVRGQTEEDLAVLRATAERDQALKLELKRILDEKRRVEESANLEKLAQKNLESAENQVLARRRSIDSTVRNEEQEARRNAAINARLEALSRQEAQKAARAAAARAAEEAKEDSDGEDSEGSSEEEGEIPAQTTSEQRRAQEAAQARNDRLNAVREAGARRGSIGSSASS